MNETPTPETDSELKRICGNWNNAGNRVQEFVQADFARKLERERDEARETEDNDTHAELAAWELLAEARRERDELREAIRNLRDVKGRHHTQIAAEKLIKLIP